MSLSATAETAGDTHGLPALGTEEGTLILLPVKWWKQEN